MRFTCSIFAASLALAGIVRSAPPTSSPAPVYTNKRDLGFYIDAKGKMRFVHSPNDWQKRREHVLANMRRVMGDLPEDSRRVPLDIRVLREEKLGGVIRQKITFVPEPGDLVHAYLIKPANAESRRPAMLCPHQTIDIGKDEPAGLGKNPNLRYALELAERGFVTLAPDYWRFGERAGRFDPYQHGYVSGTMKGIWDHMRGIDLLQSLPQVDPAKIGAIGHSLGGHNSLFVAIFDPRVRVVVTSCGFNSFFFYAASKYGNGNLANWATPTYMPRITSVYHDDPNQMPFDWTEALACIAPRPVFVNAPKEDINFVLPGVQTCIDAARPIYSLLGNPNGLMLASPDAEHDFPPEVREKAYRFIEQSLK